MTYYDNIESQKFNEKEPMMRDTLKAVFYTLKLIVMFENEKFFPVNTEEKESINTFDITGFSTKLNSLHTERKTIERKSKTCSMWLVGSFGMKLCQILDIVSCKNLNTERIWSKLEVMRENVIITVGNMGGLI